MLLELLTNAVGIKNDLLRGPGVKRFKFTSQPVCGGEQMPWAATPARDHRDICQKEDESTGIFFLTETRHLLPLFAARRAMGVVRTVEYHSIAYLTEHDRSGQLQYDRKERLLGEEKYDLEEENGIPLQGTLPLLHADMSSDALTLPISVGM